MGCLSEPRSLCSSGCPGIDCVHQAGLELTGPPVLSAHAGIKCVLIHSTRQRAFLSHSLIDLDSTRAAILCLWDFGTLLPESPVVADPFLTGNPQVQDGNPVILLFRTRNSPVFELLPW